MIACLAAPLTKINAQVRLGLMMPSLEPRQVAAKDARQATATSPVASSLMPGETITFTGPDAVGGAAQPAFIGGANFIADQTPLRAFAYSHNSLQSSSASTFQYNDFAIPESTVIGSVTGAVVTAQISGSASVRGFLFAMGACEANAGVDVEVMDITDANFPLVVSSQRIADYGAGDQLSPSVGGSVDVGGEGGFPYAGVSAGGSIEAALQFSPILRFVRDDLTFGFSALLKRGHIYRVQIELSVDTTERLFGGTAIASFYSVAAGGPVIPNVFDPDPTPVTKGAENSWLSLLAPMAGAIPNLQIAKGNADVVSRSVDIGGGTFNLASIWNQSIADVATGTFGFLSSNEAARKFSGHALLGELFQTPPLSIGQLVKNSPFLAVRNEGYFETIPLPGVAVLGPTIMLDNDQVELAERAANRTIEANLSQGDLLVSQYLPAAFGGELERGISLVTDLIAKSRAAGYRTRGAEIHLDLSLKAKDQGSYRAAYRELHEAYVALSRGP